MDAPATLRGLAPGAHARVVAVLRAFSLDAVMGRLLAVHSGLVAVEQVRGYGRQKDHLEFYEDAGFEGSFLPKVRIEFTVGAEGLGPALAAVCAGARTGRIGDGKVFVQLLNELGEAAA